MKAFIVFLFFVVCTCAFAQPVPEKLPAKWDGVLDKNGKYIPGSVLVWAQNALRAKKWSELGGISILQAWHDAVVRYDNAIIAKQQVDGLGNFYIIPVLLGLVQPYIDNYACRQWLHETQYGFGDVVHGLGVNTVTLKQANDYMIERYPAFEKACGPPK